MVIVSVATRTIARPLQPPTMVLRVPLFPIAFRVGVISELRGSGRNSIGGDQLHRHRFPDAILPRPAHRGYFSLELQKR